jgi:DNA-binding beta-propeller fold protein YncE
MRGLAVGATIAILSSATAITQSDVVDPATKALPNPNPRVTKNFGTLPDGRTWGNTAGVDIGPDGQLWTYDRCGANSCAGSNVDPILKFDRNTGKLLASFGRGQFIFPHGLYVDRDGNIWVTDGRSANEMELAKFPDAKGKGHTVTKFSPDGKVLLQLGKPGVGAKGADTFLEPNDVVTTPGGDIFVSDGHSGQNPNAGPDTNARILKFTKDGKYVKEWGKWGSAPGEFKTPHALALDSRGRLYVADRGNHRIQIFDQDGKFLEEWKQFSRVSGLFITRNDTLYAIDSESSPERHPNWKTGVRIGTTKEDKVLQFIPPHALPAGGAHGAAGEGVAVDRDGNVYAAEGPLSRQAAEGGLTKYSKN